MNVSVRCREGSRRSVAGKPHPVTQSQPAYEPENHEVRRGWQLVVAGLLLLALASLSVRSVCLPDRPGARESGFGVRHEQRGTEWYHCEPWIRRVLGD